MKELKYDKLVRNNIPEIIKQSGKKCVCHLAGKEEYRTKLYEKIYEEIEEFKATPNVEEAADILEVLYSVFESFELERSEIEQVRKQKLGNRGGFDKKVILEKVIESSM